MSSLRLKGLWSLLREYNFVIPQNKENELTCILCKKILIDTKQAPCACKYCADCINNYLSEGPLLCPGPTAECKEEDLDLNYNVSNNYATNREISKLIVKCPVGNCTFTDMLVNMETHVNTCGKPEVNCPYFITGCDKVSHEMKELDDHLQSNHYKHADMLLKTIENFKNDIDFLTNQNNVFKEELQRKQLSINMLKQKISGMVEDYNQWKREQEEFTNLSNELKMINSDFKKDTNIESYGVLIWKIEHISSLKSLNNLNSKPFLTHVNGYKMQIRVHSNSARCLMFYPNCIRGDDDDYLVWPFNCRVTIGIINPSTGQSELEQICYMEYSSPVKSQVRPFIFSNYHYFVSNGCLTIKSSVEIG